MRRAAASSVQDTSPPARTRRLVPLAVTMMVFCLVVYFQMASGAGADKADALKLTIIDAATGKRTPARIELLDQKGKAYIAADAVPENRGPGL